MLEGLIQGYFGAFVVYTCAKCENLNYFLGREEFRQGYFVVRKEFKKYEVRILLNALQRNMEHARHQETQRLSLFSFYAIIIAALISVMPLVGFMTWGTVLVICFMCVFSLLIYSTFLKWNAEFGNLIAASQWVCERLGLVGYPDKTNEEEFKNTLKKAKIKEPRREYSYINETYMAFPLPLSIRVHELTFTLFPSGFAALSLGLALGLTIYLPASTSSVSGYGLLIAIGPALVSTAVLFQLCRRVAGRIRNEAQTYREFRKPKDCRA